MTSKHQPRGVAILYEDRDVIVVNKASGILTCATRRCEAFTAEVAITRYLQKGNSRAAQRAWLVHRLDRETSGVMLFAKTEAVQQYFRDNWSEVTTKIYRAEVEGVLATPSGTFESFLAEDENLYVHSVSESAGGKYARTDYEVLATAHGVSSVRIVLKSGRKNQIRVHFQEAGHPVLGDKKYNPHGRPAKRLMLHAWQLTFIHPHTKESMTFTAPVPWHEAHNAHKGKV